MSEKRHFKIIARHGSGESPLNYLRLFDAIEQQDNYNEGAIKEIFSGERFIRHLPSEKNYLYHQLLESLNDFNKNKTFLSRYSNLLISIEILYNRGLFDQCKKLLRKAKKEAYSLEKFTLLLLLLRWETLIYIKDEDEKRLNMSMSEEVRILEVIRIQYVLMKLAFNIQIQIDKGNVTGKFIREHEEQLTNNYPRNKHTDSFWARYYYQSAIGLLSSIQNQQERRYQCYKKIKVLMDDSPQFIRDLPGIYHLNSNNLVNIMFFLRKYKEAEDLIHQQRLFLNTYGIKRPALGKIVFLNTYESELFLFYKTGRFEEGLLLLKEIEPEARKINPTFSPVLFDLLYQMAVMALMAKNYKTATRLLNRILNNESLTNLRKEIRINTRLLYTIVLYESGDILLESRIKSTRRFLAKESAQGYQYTILEIIQALSDDPAQVSNKDQLRKLYDTMRKTAFALRDETLNKQFDFTDWIKSKLRL